MQNKESCQTFTNQFWMFIIQGKSSYSWSKQLTFNNRKVFWKICWEKAHWRKLEIPFSLSRLRLNQIEDLNIRQSLRGIAATQLTTLANVIISAQLTIKHKKYATKEAYARERKHDILDNIPNNILMAIMTSTMTAPNENDQQPP